MKISLGVKLVLSLVIGFSIVACSAAGREIAVVDAAKAAICVAANQDKDLATIIVNCGLQNFPPSDVANMLAANKAGTAKALAAARDGGADAACSK